MFEAILINMNIRISIGNRIKIDISIGVFIELFILELWTAFWLSLGFGVLKILECQTHSKPRRHPMSSRPDMLDGPA